MIPAAAVEAAAEALADRNRRPKEWPFYLSEARSALEAATPYMHSGKLEWGIFRLSDEADCDPHEDRLYPLREAAQDAIDADYHQPDKWEVRGRLVGQWSTNPYRSQA